ncbi:hypothetical protein BDV59DRAFT_180002 [Aspergillus ambiguus]|uniref:uncharacterized protein n=1 Tax=Aspergillus ambiguus TaxID=176160 RepID=UPI003CCD7D9F
MPSTDNQQAFVGSSTEFSEIQTVVLPGEVPRLRRADTSPAGHPDMHREGLTKPWRPNPDRRQSWNEQDMRHQSQSRLLDLEEGRETGFTEEPRGF